MASVWGVLSAVTMSDRESELLDNPDSPPSENEAPGEECRQLDPGNKGHLLLVEAQGLMS